MPPTAYLLGVQEKFPTNLFSKHRKHDFAMKALQYTQNCNYIGTMHHWGYTHLGLWS